MHVRAWVFAMALAATAGCGDNRSVCDYREASDATNGSDAEVTGLSAGTVAMCGNFEGGHFDAALDVVDEDRYRVNVGGDGEIAIALLGDPELAVYRSVTVRVFSADVSPVLYAEGALALAAADHLAFSAQIPPGDADIVVAATSTSEVVGALPYRVRLASDPARACPRSRTRADYSERDTRANEAATVDFSHDPSVVADGSSPEATGVTLVAGINAHLAGTATATPAAGAYLDGDAFAFTADATTNELTVRLDWDTIGADLDVLVLDAETLAPVAIGARTSTSDGELALVAVKPEGRYLVWVGRFAAGDPGGASVPYDVTLCGGYFY